MTGTQFGMLFVALIWIAMLVYWSMRGGPNAGKRAVDRKLHKARLRELNTTGRILNALNAANNAVNPARVYVITCVHRSWKEGRTIEVRHQTKTWAKSLKITVNCSLTIDKQLAICYDTDIPSYYSLEEECVKDAISQGERYMNTLRL